MFGMYFHTFFQEAIEVLPSIVVALMVGFAAGVVWARKPKTVKVK